MDPTDVPDIAGGSDDDVNGPSAADRLLERLSELRLRLEQVAPDDPARWRETIESMRQAEERIRALDHMLSWAREREAAMTVRLAGAEMRLAESESRAAELGAMAEKVSVAEAGRLAAETFVAEAHQLLTTARAELEAQDLELHRLRFKCSDLEADMATLTGELASFTVARAMADRLERQRDDALERARTEARLALEARVRAADAEGQLVTLRERLRDAEERAAWLAEEMESPAGVSDASADIRSAAGPAARAPTDDAVPATETEPGDMVDLAQDESIEEDEVIDITEEAQSSDDDVAAERDMDEAVVWGEPSRRSGFVEWIRRGFLGE